MTPDKRSGPGQGRSAKQRREAVNEPWSARMTGLDTLAHELLDDPATSAVRVMPPHQRTAAATRAATLANRRNSQNGDPNGR